MTRLLEKWAVDPPLVFAIFAMTLFGIAMIYSAGVVHIPNAVTQDAWVKQAAWFAIALVAFTVLARVPLRWIEWVAVPSYVVGVLLLAITLVIGTGAGTAIGVKSWIRIGGFGFQPSEFAKIATILMLARVLSQRKEPLTSLRDLLLPSVLVGLPLALIMLQPDLGTALAFGGILFAILFWAGTPVALLLLVARIALTRWATIKGASLAGAPPLIRKRAWQGLVSQGGVSLGLILMIQGKFPELGAGVVALAMAIVLGNILGGPILLGRALAAGGSSAQGSEAPE